MPKLSLAHLVRGLLLSTVVGASIGPTGANQSHAAESDYGILTRYKLDGTGTVRGIKVDSKARRLYVAQGDKVEILDTDTGKTLGEIAGKDVRAVVLVPKSKQGFVSNGEDNSVSMFDVETAKVLKTIKLAGTAPDAIDYDEDTNRVFVAGGESGTVSVIDATSGAVLSTIKVGGRLGALTHNGYGSVYVVAEDMNAIHVIDAHKLSFEGDFPVDCGGKPMGMSLDPSSRRLFVACDNGRLALVDTDIGMTFLDLKTGSGASGVAYAAFPQGKGGWKGAVFAATADGKLTVIKKTSPVKWAVDASVPLVSGAKALAVDDQSHHVLIPALENQAPVVLVLGQKAKAK